MFVKEFVLFLLRDVNRIVLCDFMHFGNFLCIMCIMCWMKSFLSFQQLRGRVGGVVSNNLFLPL